MGRNNPKNIKAHNDKLHKEQAKEKAKKNIINIATAGSKNKYGVYFL